MTVLLILLLFPDSPSPMFIDAISLYMLNQCQVDIQFALGPPKTPHCHLVHIYIRPCLAFIHIETLGVRKWFNTSSAGVIKVCDHDSSTNPALPPSDMAL
jgi:hypothetical protein